jgi:ribosomal protein S18 acetylase RimI-like enzyme
MELRAVTTGPHFDKVWPLLAMAMGAGDDARRSQWQNLYLRDANHRLWVLEDGGRSVGLVGVRLGDPAEITHVAVGPAERGRGYGAELIASLRLLCPGVTTWYAETDDDAVGFYRRLGFFIKALPPKYPGVTRYGCTLEARKPNGRQGAVQ